MLRARPLPLSVRCSSSLSGAAVDTALLLGCAVGFVGCVVLIGFSTIVDISLREVYRGTGIALLYVGTLSVMAFMERERREDRKVTMMGASFSALLMDAIVISLDLDDVSFHMILAVLMTLWWMFRCAMYEAGSNTRDIATHPENV